MATSRLLLVEDDDSNRLTLTVLLEDEGFEVESAATLAEARRALGTARSFTAVLLDQALGTEYGLDLIPTIRAQHPQTRIVVVSGASADEVRETVQVEAVVQKGDGFTAVLDTLRRVTSG